MKAHRNRKRVQSIGQAVALMVTAGRSVGAANAQNTIRPASKDAAPAQTRASQATDPLAGVVKTPDGKPVKDAAVFWIERERDGKVQRRFTTDTDAQGRFTFSEPLPKPGAAYVTMLVQAQDWGLTFGDVPAAAPNAAPLIITLRPAVALRVPFVDQAGKPLANVPIRVRMLSGQNIGFLEIPAAMHGRWEQKTDSGGVCVFAGLPQGVQVQFAVMSDVYAPLSYEDAIALGRATTQQAAPIQALRGGSVQGRVTNAFDGAGVGGVRVGAQAVGIGDGWGEAVTDAQGSYRMTGLRPGAYNFALFSDDERRRDVTARALEKVDIKPGSVLEHQDLTLIKGSVVTGKVTDKNTGKPIEGVMIGIYGPAHPRSGAAVQSVATDVHGVYQARVPAGAQYVYVMGLPAPSAVRYEQPREGVTVAVEGDAAQSQDFTLVPSLAQHLEPVRGQVVDEGGKPVANASLNIRRVGEERITPRDRDLHTDANGAFTLEMTSASAHLRARANDMATETTTLAQSGESVVLRLKSNALLSLKGLVTDTQGRPIAGAKVTLFDWWLGMGMGNVNVTTDAQGQYTFQSLYPDARYSVVAEAAGYGNQGSAVTQYRPGKRGSVPALPLPRADSFVAGRVVDQNGDPVAKQIVNLEGRTNKFQQAVTDAQGHFRFDGVVNEPLTLYLYDSKGFSPPRKAMPADKDVIIVRKSATPTDASNDKNREEGSRRRQIASLDHPGPTLQVASWLNTKTTMPEGLKGKIVLIDFWDTTCGPCIASLPDVQKISEQFAGRGVVVVGLHGSNPNKEMVASFVRAHNLTYPIAIDAEDPTHQTFGQTMSGYGILGIPAVAVLDRQGIVRYLDSGLDGAMKVIADLLASQK